MSVDTGPSMSDPGTQVSIRKPKEIHEMTHPARMGGTLCEEVRCELEEEVEEQAADARRARISGMP